MAEFIFPESVKWMAHTPVYGVLWVEPLERGYATTLGNALRRVLLSSIPGAAVVRVDFHGHYHEYDTIPGVREDILNIILNIKGVVIRAAPADLHRLYLNVGGPMEVQAAQIEAPKEVEIVNPDHHIATLDEEGRLEVEMEVELGRGFRPAEENKREDAPLFLIPIDADFSPIERVKFGVEEIRVGGRSGYERLTLEIWTNGALSPREAEQQAVEILGQHLSLLSEAKIEGAPAEPEEIPEELLVPLSELGIEPRAGNLLREQGIATLGDLITRTREELLDIGGFGEKTLERVEARVHELGYVLRSEREEASILEAPNEPPKEESLARSKEARSLAQEEQDEASS